MTALRETAAQFVRRKILQHQMATPANLLTWAEEAGMQVSRQTIMVSLQSLVESGEVVKLGRGGYATPQAANDESLRQDVRFFLLKESSPHWVQIPSKKNRGEWEDYEQWRAHSPTSAAKRFAMATGVELPAALFKSEIERLVQDGLLREADMGPNIKGYYWASKKGRQMMALFD